MSKMGEGGIYNAERYTKLITIGRTNLFSNIEYMKKKGIYYANRYTNKMVWAGGGAFIMLKV